MKQLVLAALLCCGLWAFGQSTDASSTPSSSGQASSASSSGSSTTVDGCLSGSSGNYTLTDKATGTSYNLSGDTSKLSAHVGHEVKITGTTSGSASSPSSSASSTASGSSSAMGGQTLSVTSFKHVAATCTASK
jgi:hypothetical protein